MNTALIPAVAFVCSLAAPAPCADDAFFDSQGIKIRYVVEGQGVPVVLIHGWMADSSMWGRDAAGNTKLDASDAPGLQLIALDCRGHGKSDKLYDPADYGLAMAEDIVRLLDHLKIDKAHIIGYSSGAFIAGGVAAAHPQRVLSVVYAGQAPIIADPSPDAPAPTDAAEVEVFARATKDGGDLGDYIMHITPADRPKPTKEQASMVAQYMFQGKDTKAIAAAGLSFKNMGVTIDRLKACPAPVLFIHGSEESKTVKDRVASVHQALGLGEIKIIEGGNHMTTLAKPEFSASIKEFWRSVK